MCNPSVIMDLQLRLSCLGIRRLKMEGVQMTAVFEFTVDCLLSIRFCEVTKAFLFHFLQLYDTDSDVAMEAADVLDEACEDEVRWTQFITI